MAFKINKKGTFWNTIFLIAGFLIFSFLIASIVYLLIKPFNYYAFPLIGSMVAPIENFANNQYEQWNKSNSELAKEMLNYSNINAEAMSNIENARKHDEFVWLIGGFIAFVLTVLFYTAYTQSEKKM